MDKREVLQRGRWRKNVEEEGQGQGLGKEGETKDQRLESRGELA